MRTLFCAIPALLTLAGTALAELQQLDEAQLGGIAAGQDTISTTSGVTNSSINSFSSSAVEETSQILNGVSSNTTYATGVGSSDVSAMGTAGVSVMGNMGGP